MIPCLGIVDFEDEYSRVEGLSDFRTIPAISFLGRYRIIDFVLSNMVNSGMDRIEVLVKDKPRSLIEHIGSGIQYNINSKQGALQILYTDKTIVNKLYYTDIALLKQYETTIAETPHQYVAIAPSYMINRLDYQDVLQKHIDSAADITCVYKHIHDGNVDFLDCREIKLDNGKVIAGKISRDSLNEKDISLETYVMSKAVLLKIINDATSLSALYSLKEYLLFKINELNVQGYEYKGYLRCINSLNQYYQTNMELISPKKAKELFDETWPIFTKTNDSPPAYYSSCAKVKNCLIANGCVVQGELENCILGRGVKVKQGCVIKNSLILPGVCIGENTNIEYTIVDKHANVKYIKRIIGSKDDIMYVARRDTV